ncbi:MAG TPA: hydrogen peroxide-inducible genes activator, partial [Hellea balneolensis]|nr:hydrogen peroxide-inducible genes activator [Hellea balneolensis]
DIKSLSTSYRDPFAGNLNLGVIPTIGPFLLPYFSGPLLKTYPKLKLAYIEDMTERLTDHLLAGQLDAAILATQPLDPALTCMPLYNENFFVALPHSHRLCGQDEVSLSDLDDVQMLLLTEGHCLRDQALSVCSTATQNQAVRATSLETLLGLVAGGHGVTLIPALAIRTGCISELGIDIRPISDPQAFRRVNLTYRKSHVRPQIFDSLTGLISSKLPPSVSGIKV